MRSVLTIHDRFGDELEISRWYIRYRNRVLDIGAVDDIRAKNNRILINHYKNNTGPTLCIHFESKEKAEKVLAYLTARWFPEPEAATGFWDWVGSWCCPRRHSE